MPVYDCRREGRDPQAKSFPCSVRFVNPVTGERIPDVFFAQTAPAKLGRFVRGVDGEPMVDAATRRKVPYTGDDGRERIRIEYDRLEVWECRPWVAVAVDGGGVIDKSEGTP